ncbi:hypothetical protein ACFLYF_02595 [Chloroflexota bacterium]
MASFDTLFDLPVLPDRKVFKKPCEEVTSILTIQRQRRRIGAIYSMIVRKRAINVDKANCPDNTRFRLLAGQKAPVNKWLGRRKYSKNKHISSI